MKIDIGPYKNYFGPYQLAEKLCFWAKPVKDKYGIESKPDWVHNFGEWLAHGSVEPEPDFHTGVDILNRNRDRPNTLLYRFLLWIESKRKRKIKIRIDPYDTWSMDSTLTMIILPMLKQLHETKHGAPLVDDDDVPEHLRSTAAPPRENEYDVDGNHFARWDWVMEELIWTFEQQQPDCDWEEQYRTGEYDLRSIPCEWDEAGKPTMYEMKDGPKHTVKIDQEGLKSHQDRINNGLRLLGKYWQSLWD
jgi:hypothetical protein